MTNASVFAYVADGKNGLRVLAAGLGERDGGRVRLQPAAAPKLIATYHTHEPALAISKGLDRDRAVDESGNQVAVFGRRGGRPFNLEEMQRMYPARRQGRQGRCGRCPDRGRRRQRHAAPATRSGCPAPLEPRSRSGAQSMSDDDASRIGCQTATIILDSPVDAARRPRSARSSAAARSAPPCAFRAKELGLAALVIDYRRPDEAHPRLREGQADPARLRRRRHDAVPRRRRARRRAAVRADRQGSDGASEWKSLYRKYSVPAQVGVELLRTRAAGRRRLAGGRRGITTRSRTQTLSSPGTSCSRSDAACRGGSTFPATCRTSPCG